MYLHIYTGCNSRARKDPLEEAVSTLSSILAWEISWTEEPGRLQSSAGLKRVRNNLATKQLQQWYTHTHIHTNTHSNWILRCTQQKTALTQTAYLKRDICCSLLWVDTARVANPALSSGWKDYSLEENPWFLAIRMKASPLRLLPRTTLINRLFLFMIFLPLSHKFSLLQNMAIFYRVLTSFWDSAKKKKKKKNYWIWKEANDHKKYSVQNLYFSQNIWSISLVILSYALTAGHRLVLEAVT